jgi:hypothetical protein
MGMLHSFTEYQYEVHFPKQRLGRIIFVLRIKSMLSSIILKKVLFIGLNLGSKIKVKRRRDKDEVSSHGDWRKRAGYGRMGHLNLGTESSAFARNVPTT